MIDQRAFGTLRRECLSAMEHADRVNSANYSPDGTYLDLRRETVRVWELENQRTGAQMQNVDFR